MLAKRVRSHTVAVACALLLVLLGAQSILAAQNQVLRVWWWGEADVPGSRQFLEQAAREFESANPGVKVELVEQTSEQLYPAFRAAAEAGSGPDIQFLFSGSWLLEDVWRGNLEPLDKYFTKQEIDNWQMKEAYTYGGKVWAMPWYSMSVVMVYNKTLFSKAGLNPDLPPKTWDEFLQACQKLKAAGIVPIGYGVKSPWSTSWLSALFMLEEFDNVDQVKELAVQEGGFLRPQVVRFYERIAELVKRGYFNDTVMSLDYSQARDEFLRGNAAMSVASSADLKNIMSEMKNDKVWVMRTPTYGTGHLKGGLVTQVQLFTIPSFAKNKQLAVKFLRFLQSEKQLKKYYDITSAFPANKAFKREWLVRDIDRFIYDWMSKAAGPYVDLFMPPMIGDEGLYPSIQNVFGGSMNPDKATKYLEQVAKRWRMLNSEQVKNYEKWAK